MSLEASCAFCGVKPAKFKCSRCQGIHYCKLECQKSDWKRHKIQDCMNSITKPKNDSNDRGLKKESAFCDSSLPSFECPLTLEVMVDPVIISLTGQTYERSSIEKWLSNKDTCPNTNIVLNGNHQLVPNIVLRQAIEEWNKIRNEKQKFCDSNISIIDKAADLVTVDGVVVALKRMASSQRDVSLAIKICDALLTLTSSYDSADAYEYPCCGWESNFENIEKAGAGGAIGALLSIINAHIDSDVVCQYACHALRNLTFFCPNKDTAGAVGAVEVVMKVLKNHMNSAHVCEFAFDTLGLLVSHPHNGAKAHALGAVKVIVRVIEKYIGSSSFCRNGCCALLLFIKNEEYRPEAIAAGAVQIIVCVINIHMASVAVNEKACNVLSALTSNVSNNSKARSKGAMEAVIRVLSTHVGSASVCEAACGALCGFVSDDYDRSRAGILGAVDITIQIMNVHMESAVVCEWACDALCNLIEDNTINGKKALAADIIQVIMRVLGNHLDSALACKYACCVFGHLAVNEDIIAMVVAAGAVEAVVRVITTHMNSADICEFVSWVLYELVVNDDSIARAVGSGAIEASVQVINTHMDESAATVACDVLEKLVSNNNDYNARAGAVGAVEAVVRYINSHIDSSDVLCQTACTALSSLATNDSNRAKACALGAMNALILFLNGHMDSDERTERACIAIADIAASASGGGEANWIFIEPDRVRATHTLNTVLNTHRGVPETVKEARRALSVLNNMFRGSRNGSGGHVESNIGGDKAGATTADGGRGHGGKRNGKVKLSGLCLSSMMFQLLPGKHFHGEMLKDCDSSPCKYSHTLAQPVSEANIASLLFLAKKVTPQGGEQDLAFRAAIARL